MNHSALDAANEQMKQYAHDMSSNLESLLAELVPVKEGFQGAAATAFQDFQQTVQLLDSAMSTEFDKGSDNLAEMHLTIKNADTRSASLFPNSR